MQQAQGSNNLRRLRAKPLRKQGGAGFLVKTFTGQSYGIFLLLFVREVPLGPLGRLWPAEPQGGPFSILPSLQPLDSESSSSPLVLAASTRRGTQDSVGQHQQVHPSPFIIVLRNCGESAGEAAGPQRTSTERNMPQSRCPTGLQF